MLAGRCRAPHLAVPGAGRQHGHRGQADASPAQAFGRFESLRWQRTADIVNRSRDNAQRFHNPRLSDPAQAVDYVNQEWEPEKVRRRYDWLFEYDPLTTPL